MAGRIIRATCFCVAYGQQTNVTPHFRVGDIGGDWPAVIAELRANFLTYLLPAQYTSAVWNRVDIKEVSDPTLSTYSQAIVPLTGTGQATGSGPIMSALFSFQTGFAAISKRGRMYLPGTNLGMSNAGQISTTLTTTLNAVALNIKNRYLPGGTFHGNMGLVVWSRKNEEDTTVTNIAVRPNFGAQRRRNIGVGM